MFVGSLFQSLLSGEQFYNYGRHLLVREMGTSHCKNTINLFSVWLGRKFIFEALTNLSYTQSLENFIILVGQIFLIF